MSVPMRRAIGWGVWVWAAVVLASAGRLAAQSRWNGSYFPNVALTTHDGKAVRFYDEIKGKTVAIELMYTSCKFACPLETARLAEVYKLLGDRMGKDVYFYSISIDPRHDTPAVLKAFADRYHAGAGWTFLTGKEADIELLSRKLGLYSPPDPDNPDGHTPTLLIGNEATGQWTRGSAVDNPKMTAAMIGNWVGGYENKLPFTSSRESAPLTNYSSGAYLFGTKCGACHNVGGGDKIGPDLAGVTARRDPSWLRRYIANPDAVLKAGDPVAKGLAAKFKLVQMPNLGLTPDQVTDVIGYLARPPVAGPSAGSK